MYSMMLCLLAQVLPDVPPVPATQPEKTPVIASIYLILHDSATGILVVKPPCPIRLCPKGNWFVILSPGDFDCDDDVDAFDYMTFASCYNGTNNPPKRTCMAPCTDIEGDGDVDNADYLTFLACYNGSNKPPRLP